MTKSSSNRAAWISVILCLPIVGALLLLPPLAGIFQLDMRIAGVPVTAVYLFGVWAILIIAAYALSRALQNAEHTTAVETDASRESSPEDDPH